MRKIKLFVLILVVFSPPAYSQFNKGSLLLGADLSFDTQTFTNGASENKLHGFYLSPVIAVATKQNTFWGGSLSAGNSKSESRLPDNKQTNNRYGASVFCRKYKAVTGKLFAFLQGGLAAGFAKYENNSGPDSYSENKSFYTGLTITPGISVNVAKKVYLEAGLSNIASVNYSHSKTNSYNFGNTTSGKSSGFAFSSSLGGISNNLYFGFRFIIPKNG
jgi:hypothetical protein